MGEIFKLFGTIGLNNDEANKGIDETTGKAEKSSGKIAGFFKKAAVAIGTVFAAKKLIDFGKLAVEAAAGAQALQAQFEQVFGDMQDGANKAINDMAKEFGMVPSRLKPGMTKMTSMFKGLGLDTKEAMGKAAHAVELSADAAAFYDVSFESANQSLTSFLKGNYEAGEAIGIFANETQMAQFAISQGIVGSTQDWQALDEATKQATRLEYAANMQEMAGATGQAARESDGYENQMGNLKQAWQDFLAIVGGPILEPVVNGLQRVSDWLSTAGTKVQDLQAWFSDFKTEVAESTAWNTLKEVMQPVVDAFNNMKDTMSNSTFLDDIKSALTDLKDAMLEVDFVKLKDDIQAFIDKWLPLIAGIGAAATAYGLYTLALGIKSAAETIAIVSMYAMAAATTALNGALAILTSPITLVIAAIVALVAIGVYLWQNWDTISAKASEIWGGIASFFSATWQSIKQGIEVAWNAISSWLSGVWSGIKSVATTVWNAIKAVFTTVVSAIVTFVVGRFNNLKTNISTIFNAVKSVATTVWNAIKNAIQSVVNAIKSVVTNVFNSIKSTVSSIFNSIKSTASSIWNGIKSTISNIINGIKSNVSSGFNSVKSTVSSIWNSIKSAITNPIQAAKNTISTIIDAIKRLFNFKISWPKIPMPSFGISPSGWKIGDLLKGSIPKLAVSWNAKGGIFNEPTIFDTAKGLQGVGEAGPEAIIPLNRETLGGIGQGIADTMDFSNSQIMGILAEIKDSLIELLSRNNTVVIQVDGKTIASVIYDPLNDMNGEGIRIIDRGLA